MTTILPINNAISHPFSCFCIHFVYAKKTNRMLIMKRFLCLDQEEYLTRFSQELFSVNNIVLVSIMENIFHRIPMLFDHSSGSESITNDGGIRRFARSIRLSNRFERDVVDRLFLVELLLIIMKYVRMMMMNIKK